MRLLPFTKVQSIGNHFVLLRQDEIESLDLNALAIQLCEPRFGIGADGLLVVSKGAGDVILRMFNADGSEDFCGNGLRCAAMFAHQHGWVGTSFRIQHGGLHVRTVIHVDQTIEVELPAASFLPADVPYNEAQEIWRQPFEGALQSSLSTGSTHTILEVNERPNDEVFFPTSQRLENDPMFPTKSSVMWSYPFGDKKIALRIWERGVGETLGCGTGSAAAAVVWMRGNKSGGTVEVINPGGSLFITADSYDSPLWMRGKPHEVYRGIYAPALSPATI